MQATDNVFSEGKKTIVNEFEQSLLGNKNSPDGKVLCSLLRKSMPITFELLEECYKQAFKNVQQKRSAQNYAVFLASKEQEIVNHFPKELIFHILKLKIDLDVANAPKATLFEFNIKNDLDVNYSTFSNALLYISIIDCLGK